MDKRNLYIIIAVILVAGLVLSFSGLTGKSISNLGTPPKGCIDTDGGIEKETKGTVSYRNRDYKYTDYCFPRGIGPEKWLNEYYCLADRITSENFQCYNGCVDGACIR